MFKGLNEHGNGSVMCSFVAVFSSCCVSKFVSVHAMETHRGSTVTAPVVPNLIRNGDE